jgi:hypothetical protein
MVIPADDKADKRWYQIKDTEEIYQHREELLQVAKRYLSIKEAADSSGQ